MLRTLLLFHSIYHNLHLLTPSSQATFPPTASLLATMSLFLCLSRSVLKNAMPLGCPAGEPTPRSERRDKGDEPISPQKLVPLANSCWPGSCWLGARPFLPTSVSPDEHMNLTFGSSIIMLQQQLRQRHFNLEWFSILRIFKGGAISLEIKPFKRNI